jgi:hypothetical protein
LGEEPAIATTVELILFAAAALSPWHEVRVQLVDDFKQSKTRFLGFAAFEFAASLVFEGQQTSSWRSLIRAHAPVQSSSAREGNVVAA